MAMDLGLKMGSSCSTMLFSSGPPYLSLLYLNLLRLVIIQLFGCHGLW